MRVRVLNRVITKIYDDCLRPHGLRAAQQNILIAISLMKLATPSELERRLSLDKSTVSRNVERMRRRGWIELISAEDGRSHHLHVTSEGMKLLRKTLVAWEQAQKKTAALLGKQGITALFRLDAAPDADRA
jgi:DNA-binding MarR family transcriptional regulator